MSSNCFQQTLSTASLNATTSTARSFVSPYRVIMRIFCRSRSIVFPSNLHINVGLIKFDWGRLHQRSDPVNAASPPLPLERTWEWHFKVNRACILLGFRERTRVVIMALEILSAAAAFVVSNSNETSTENSASQVIIKSRCKSSWCCATSSVIQSKIDILFSSECQMRFRWQKSDAKKGSTSSQIPSNDFSCNWLSEACLPHTFSRSREKLICAHMVSPKRPSNRLNICTIRGCKLWN